MPEVICDLVVIKSIAIIDQGYRNSRKCKRIEKDSVKEYYQQMTPQEDKSDQLPKPEVSRDWI